MKLDEFTQQYIIAALWSSYDNEGEALDRKYSIDDISAQTLEAMKKDCNDFRVNFAELIKEALAGSTNQDETNIAHDFWLTRNGHGAGFWDGDYPKELGDKLTDAAHSFGEVDLYVGDDGCIYG